LGACTRSDDAQAYINEAKALEAKRDRQGAIIELKNALRQEPGNREARLWLGQSYIAVGEFPSAEKELRKARGLGVPPEQITPQLAKALLGMHEYGRVVAEIKATPGMDGATLAAIHAARGVAYLALNQLPEAETSFREAEAADATHPETQLGLAQFALALGEREEAMRRIAAAISRDSKHLDAWLMKAGLLWLTGKAEEAAAAYRKAAEIDPDHVGAHLGLAYFYLGRKDLAAAQQAIDAAAKRGPRALGVRFMSALLAFDQGKLGSANEHLEAILSARPDHLPSLLISGAVNYDLGNYEWARTQLRKVLGKVPANPHARKLMAATQLALHEPRAALDTLAALGIESSGDPSVLAIAGEAAMALGEYAKATEYYEAASRLSPHNVAIKTEMALSRLAKGDVQRAMRELKAVAGQNTKFFKPYVLLALAHLGRREFDEALATIAEIGERLPASPLVENLRGEAYLGKEDRISARKSFEQAFAVRSDFHSAANLARMDLEDKDAAAAQARFEAVLAKNPEDPQATMALAQLAMINGRENEQLTWLEKAAWADQQALAPRVLLAQYWLRKSNPDKALAYATEAVNAAPGDAGALDLLGRIQLANGDNANAMGTFKRLAEVQPQSAGAQARLGQVLAHTEDWEGARKAVGRALTLDPDQIDAKALLTGLELRARRFDQALALARELQSAHPENPIGIGLEGDILFTKKQGQAAAKAYETAFALVPSGALAIKVHQAYSMAGQAAAGDSRLTQWLDKHPEDRLVRAFLANTTLEAGDLAKAASHHESLLVEDPNDVVRLNNLAWIYQRLKNHKALAVAQRAYQLKPNSPAIMDTYAWILVEKGDTQRGIELLRQALSLSPDAAEIHWHLAYALHKAGDKSRARQELERLLDSGLTFPEATQARSLLQQLAGR
jgi:putative PEP-CTERM system TPR-repeat lipoprotein